MTEVLLTRLYFSWLPACVKPRAGDVMFVDVGVYGHASLPDYAGKDNTLRRFERFTLEHNGFQALYAETLMNKEEFKTMFPREIYDEVIIGISNITSSYNFYFVICSGSKKIS